MKPIKFKEANTTYGENQPKYTPLPAYRDEEGQVISCWQLTWKERLQVLWTGVVWSRVLTFNRPIQPQVLHVENPFTK